MPLPANLADDLAQPVVEVYANAERIILARIARSLAAGIDAPGWAEAKLLEVQLLQRHAAADITAAAVQGSAQTSVSVASAWNRGTAVAERDLARAVLGGLRRSIALQTSLDAIISEATTTLATVAQRVLRAVPDVYRDVIRAAVPQALIGVQTRKEAAQGALDELAGRGLTGFVDARGRTWALDSYVEMATRTAVGRAVVDGHASRLTGRGFNLVSVSDAPQECVLCRPFEGKVFSLDGLGVAPDGPALMTLDEARARGLFHPNCRHTSAVYLPGITTLPEHTEDPQGDKDRQKLRALERNVRAARRREAVALDPQARAAARADIRRHQAAIREHVATTSAKRQPDRERLTVARPVKADPFARDTDEELQAKLMREFESGAPDEQRVEQISVQMDLRDKYAGTSRSEHYRRRNTVLDEGFVGQSDEDIADLIEQAIASGDPEAAAFVNDAHIEIRNRTYAGKNIHRPPAKRAPKPQAESKASKLRRARADFDLLQEQQRGELENATNGNLIRKDREAEYRQKHGGSELTFILEADPQTMFRYASEEVRRFYADHQRLTFAEFAVQAGIDDPALADRAERARRRALDASRRAEERDKPRKRRA